MKAILFRALLSVGIGVCVIGSIIADRARVAIQRARHEARRAA